MYDSTTALDIPSEALLVAGYIDGIYAWSDAGWALFPNAVKVRIAVFSTTQDGHVGDVEDGCMTPEGGAAWVRMRRAAGADPTLYVNHSNWQQTRDALAALGEPEPHWWLASYDNDPTLPEGCVAKQYANEPLTGGHYDASSVADFWPGIDKGGDMASLGPEDKAYIEAKFAELYSVLYALERRTLRGQDALDPDNRPIVAGEQINPSNAKKAA